MTRGYQLHPCPREEIDRELLEDLKADGMGFAERHSVYIAVRMFGGSHW